MRHASMGHASNFFSGGGFPDTGSPVMASRNHILAIWAECNRGYMTLMHHACNFFAGGGFPHPDGIIIASRDYIFAIWAECNRGYTTIMIHAGNWKCSQIIVQQKTGGNTVRKYLHRLYAEKRGD